MIPGQGPRSGVLQLTPGAVKQIKVFLKYLSMWLLQVLVAACGIQFPDQGLNPGKSQEVDF